MTARKDLTTQSKLTVYALSLGCGVPDICAVHGAMSAAHILVRCPVTGVAYTEVCLSAYVKDLALCHTASLAWVLEKRRYEDTGRGTRNEERGTENGRRHISCAPSRGDSGLGTWDMGLGTWDSGLGSKGTVGASDLETVGISVMKGIKETAHFMCTVLSLESGSRILESVLQVDGSLTCILRSARNVSLSFGDC